MPLKNVVLGDNVSITHPDLVNIYDCQIGSGSKIGPFVEIQKNSSVGNNCKISSHSFICEGVTIEDSVMIAHGVVFTNDLFPRATNDDGTMQGEADWKVVPTKVCKGASIGPNATILAGVTIGPRAVVGAGAVVTHDVPENTIVAGVPARVLRVLGDTAEASDSKVTFLKTNSAE